MKNYILVQRLFHKLLLVVIYNGKATFSTQQCHKKFLQSVGGRKNIMQAHTPRWMKGLKKKIIRIPNHSTSPRAPLPHRHSVVKSRVTQAALHLRSLKTSNMAAVSNGGRYFVRFRWKAFSSRGKNLTTSTQSSPQSSTQYCTNLVR